MMDFEKTGPQGVQAALKGRECRLLRLREVTGGDTYEIAYARSYPENHWGKDSLYLPDDETGIGLLAPYLEAVFPQFDYYGPQKISLTQWAQVEDSYRSQGADAPSLEPFFSQVRRWLSQGNDGADYFWILGV